MTAHDGPPAGRPLPVAVRAWVESAGWGAIAGAGYGLLIIGGLMLLTLPRVFTEPSELMGSAAFGVFAAYLGGLGGGLAGGAYGVLAGVPLAIGMSALSVLNRPGRVVRLRVLGAATAFTAVALTGIGLILGFEGHLTNPGRDTTVVDAPNTAIWIAVLTLAPGVIAAAIFAWRTPSITQGRTAERPLFASAEDRRAAVARLTE